ncbi:sugar phosphate isomerase/epimerase family protein [Rosistilla oblonga]|uniref:Xylose isomerase-like TIM barrel n=1 Tax=Rosistilla oblonga TaxID=2527990 RepID=A0A518J017_9BACT|nr:sugar phosphate isomerase/epimerase family protein [Rosistilla oblonga]QDV58635.1 Xylose isomerase-like TIM barrel [Rosistilla oblonga]
MEKWPIGVFASVDAGLGVRWEVIKELGVPTIQLHAPAAETRTQANADKLRSQMEEMSVELTAVFGGFEGESYADIPTVVETVGLVPEATRAARLQEMKEIADFAKLIECDVVALHLGFVPHETSDPSYEGIVTVMRDLCDHAANNGQRVHLETGQETADGLLQFLSSVERDNLFVNFDPANMILYGTGEPIPALQKVGSFVRSVHCKDGTWSDKPGETWGAEVPLGEGQVDMRKYLQTLNEIGYTGPLTIEREIPAEPERQLKEIGAAVALLTKLKSELLA